MDWYAPICKHQFGGTGWSIRSCTLVHEWLSLKEAAHYLRVSRRTMYNLMDRGVLRCHEIPGLRGRWFKREELDALRRPGGTSPGGSLGE